MTIHIVRAAVEYALKALNFTEQLYPEVSFYQNGRIIATARVNPVSRKEMQMNKLSYGIKTARHVFVAKQYQNKSILESDRIVVDDLFTAESFCFDRVVNGNVIYDYLALVKRKENADTYQLFCNVLSLDQKPVGKMSTQVFDLTADDCSTKDNTSPSDEEQKPESNEKKSVSQTVTRNTIPSTATFIDSKSQKVSQGTQVSRNTPNLTSNSFVRVYYNGIPVGPETNPNIFLLDYILFVINTFISVSHYQTGPTEIDDKGVSNYVSWFTRLVRLYFKQPWLKLNKNYLGGYNLTVTISSYDVINQEFTYHNATFGNFVNAEQYKNVPEYPKEVPNCAFSGDLLSQSEFLFETFGIDPNKYTRWLKSAVRKITNPLTTPFYNNYPPKLKYTIAMSLLPSLYISDIYKSGLYHIAHASVSNGYTPMDVWIAMTCHVLLVGRDGTIPYLKYVDSEDGILTNAVTSVFYVPVLVEDRSGTQAMGLAAAALVQDNYDIPIVAGRWVGFGLKFTAQIYTASESSYPEYISKQKASAFYCSLLDTKIELNSFFSDKNDIKGVPYYAISAISRLGYKIILPGDGAIFVDYRKQPMANNPFTDILSRKDAKVVSVFDNHQDVNDDKPISVESGGDSNKEFTPSYSADTEPIDEPQKTQSEIDEINNESNDIYEASKRMFGY